MRFNTLYSLVLVLSGLGAAPLVRADSPINAGFPYGSSKVRGVNIGGWLVLEVIALALINHVKKSLTFDRT
jgi:hypothetical protein